MVALANNSLKGPQQDSERLKLDAASAAVAGNGVRIDRDTEQAELGAQAKKGASTQPEGGERYKDTLGAVASFLLHFAGGHPERFKLDTSKASKPNETLENPAESTKASVVGVPSERDMLARESRADAEAEKKIKAEAEAERLKAEEAAKAVSAVATSASTAASKTVV